MTELPSPDDLAEAERWLRQYFDQGDEFTHRAGLVMAEYDRRGAEIARLKADNAKYAADFLTIGAVIGKQRAIIEAATALVEAWDATPGYVRNVVIDFDDDMMRAFDALAAAVCGEGT